MQPYKQINWDTYFMNIATSVSLRSPDPKKKVGCIIVNENNRIVSTGYNGLPKKLNEYDFDWSDRNLIKSIIIHAECNALLYCKEQYNNINTNNKLYCTLSPCKDCLKMIIAYNIKKVYYKEKYKHFDEVLEISKLLDVELIYLNFC